MKFEMKSRESRCIYDSNIYSIDKLALRLGFGTEIILSENLIVSVKDYDFFGQSWEIFIDLKDYHISGEEFISYIKEIEASYKPEILNSVEQFKQFLSRASFRKATPFSIEELKNNGWIKKSNSSCIFGDNSFVYEKQISDNDFLTRSIRVIMSGDEIDSIKTKSGCADRIILSMDDLENYFNNNK